MNVQARIGLCILGLLSQFRDHAMFGIQPTPSKQSLVSILLVDRIDRALPRPVEFLQELLGRRDATCNEFLNRPQIAGLVAAGPVMLAAPRQSLFGELQRLL